MSVIKEASYHKHFYPEEHTGICVVKRKGESTENVIRRFKKKYSKSDLVKELREKMFYEKPGDKKRRKRKQNIRTLQQESKKELENRQQYKKSLRARLNKQIKKGNQRND